MKVYGLEFAVYSLHLIQLKTPNRKLQTALLVAFALTLFSSCLKEEDPVTPPNLQGDVETMQIPMGSKYQGQFFYDLGTNQIVSSNDKAVWDLAFECGLEGHSIFLNTSKLMFAWNTQTKDFFGMSSDTTAVWKWDVASGNPDSTAIGEWGDYADGNVDSYRDIYLINRGKNSDGQSYGMKKIVFGGLVNNTYTFKYANLDGTDEHIFEIAKDNDYSLMYFSFDNGGQVKNIAPPKDSWDLEFTMYTHIFSETPDNIPRPDTLIPYLVTGVLQNRNSVTVAEYFSRSFAEVTLEEVMNLGFDDEAIDIIGYDWKLFNFDEAIYDVLPQRSYIIRDTEGYLYKLQFTDFYSNTGEKGYPKFEFQRL